MPADACNATSHQMLSTHSHTDISMSVFITVDASVSVFSRTLNESEGEPHVMIWSLYVCYVPACVYCSCLFVLQQQSLHLCLND